MNDLLPFTHGQEGTHSACIAQMNRLGDKVTCCVCNNHDCESDMDNFCRDTDCPYYIMSAVHQKYVSGCKYEQN